MPETTRCAQRCDSGQSHIERVQCGRSTRIHLVCQPERWEEVQMFAAAAAACSDCVPIYLENSFVLSSQRRWCTVANQMHAAPVDFALQCKSDVRTRANWARTRGVVLARRTRRISISRRTTSSCAHSRHSALESISKNIKCKKWSAVRRVRIFVRHSSSVLYTKRE